MKKILKLIAALLLVVLMAGCADTLNLLDEGLDILDAALTEDTTAVPEQPEETEAPAQIDEDGYYTSKEDVALYLWTYGHLPDNFMTKKEAQALGWSGGNLWKFANGMSIGGDYFGNREGQLPTNVKYTECDIDYQGGSRGAKRIVFAQDCSAIYYTEDHYETFEQLYP